MFTSIFSNGSGSSRNGATSSFVIINGKRVPIGTGIHGKDLAEMATKGNSYRRGTTIRDGRAELIDPRKYYNPAELMDRRGKPVKISSIPDRTKGVTLYSGHRNEYSRQIITEQVIDVANHFVRGNVDFDEEDADWVVFPRFRLPSIWSQAEAPLLVVFPREYPTTPPIGFYLPSYLESPNGHFFGTAYHGAAQAPTMVGWNWYCCTVNAGAWSPYPARAAGEWKWGDNLWTYITLMNEVLGSPITAA